jgi:hypothetical protein
MQRLFQFVVYLCLKETRVILITNLDRPSEGVLDLARQPGVKTKVQNPDKQIWRTLEVILFT